MGLIKEGLNAVKTATGEAVSQTGKKLFNIGTKSLNSIGKETWKDFFVCESLSNDVLMTRGVKRGGNNSDNIITNGSGIVVNEGQCALIVDEGVVVEVAAEPGNYTFVSDKSPSIFDGGSAAIKNTWNMVKERFTYEGLSNKDQRVYYVNTKQIMGNTFGTSSPLPLRLYDPNTTFDMSTVLKCNGEYVFKISNPLAFFQNVAGNKETFKKDELTSLMRTEMLMYLGQAVSQVSSLGIQFDQITAHGPEITEALNEVLDEKWMEARGIELVSVAFGSFSIPDEDLKEIKSFQKVAVYKNAEMQNAAMMEARVSALKDAANNANGAGMGFLGVAMANNFGNAMTGGFQQPSNQQYTQPQQNVNPQPNPAPQQATVSEQTVVSTGEKKFCTECGAPVVPGTKFCGECGNKLI